MVVAGMMLAAGGARAADIPLGNLFDDSKKVTLAEAVLSDGFGATADDTDLGVWIVLSGFEKPVVVAPAVTFDFQNIGGSKLTHSVAINDAFEGGAQLRGIRTSGAAEPAIPPGEKIEEGVGLHANNLVTFDLAEIRKAGRLPEGQAFHLLADRIGINDTGLGRPFPTASVRFIVLVAAPAGPDGSPQVSGYVNGQAMPLKQADGVWQADDKIPDELKGDGKFLSLNVPIPGNATHVVIGTTGGSGGISSDHAVLSGLRLVPSAP